MTQHQSIQAFFIEEGPRTLIKSREMKLYFLQFFPQNGNWTSLKLFSLYFSKLSLYQKVGEHRRNQPDNQFRVSSSIKFKYTMKNIELRNLEPYFKVNSEEHLGW